jgi:hypothetical protein
MVVDSAAVHDCRHIVGGGALVYRAAVLSDLTTDAHSAERGKSSDDEHGNARRSMSSSQLVGPVAPQRRVDLVSITPRWVPTNIGKCCAPGCGVWSEVPGTEVDHHGSVRAVGTIALGRNPLGRNPLDRRLTGEHGHPVSEPIGESSRRLEGPGSVVGDHEQLHRAIVHAVAH